MSRSAIRVPAISSSRVASLLRAWQRDGIVGRVIGQIERGDGVVARRDGRPVPFPWVAQDEIVKALHRCDRRRSPPRADDRAPRAS